MSEHQREQYLDVHGTPTVQDKTITSPSELSTHLDGVMLNGIAWERDEFVLGQTCAAVGVHNSAGMIVGAVSVSAESRRMVGREREVESALRTTANSISKYLRSGG